MTVVKFFVTDAATTKPVEGVVVQAVESGKVSYTDREGFASLPTSPGFLNFRFLHKDYRTYILAQVVPEGENRFAVRLAR